MIDRYEIHEKIGQGGLGAVYRAKDKQLNREVAIKRLLRVEGQDKTSKDLGVSPESLLDEATTLSSLQHPNIVTVYDVGLEDEGWFVVMELIKGETFDLTVERGALTENDFKSFVSQTMEALLAAHEKSIIHRDLKPSNLMVNWLPSGKFQIKILDFGLAKLGKKPSVQTTDQGDGILGSIYFMAPEQFERAELDQRTDLYAMGSIYYYALTGKYPFGGDTGPLVMASHLSGNVRHVSELRPDLPLWLTNWVMELIKRKPDDRPQSSREAYEFFCRNFSPDNSIQGNKIIKEESDSKFVLPKKDPVSPLVSKAPPNTMGVSIRESQSLSESNEFFNREANRGQQKKIPVWLVVGVPILLVFAVALFVVKSGKQKVIKERNALIKSLNESETPLGNAITVQEFLAFMGSQPDNDIGRDNIIAAITTLARLEGQDVNKEISIQLSKIQGGNPIVSSGLIGVMVDKGYADGVPVILDLINDQNEQVVDAAVYAIGELGDLQNVGILLEKLEESSGKSADALESSIVRICLKDSNLEVRNSEVRRILVQEAPTGEYRKRILRILGYLGGEKAWNDLKRILDGNDSDGRKAVLQTIGSWPNGDPLKTLFEIVYNEKDEVIKRLAFRAYVLLLSGPSSLSDESKLAEIKDLFEQKFSRNDQLNLIGALASLATESALQFVDELGVKNERYKLSAEMASKQISLNISKRGNFNDIEKVFSAKNALILGEDSFNYDESQDSIIGWSNPQYYIVWPVNFSNSGKYELTLNIKKPDGGGGEFEVVLGADIKTSKVPSGDDFVEINLGEFSVKNSGTYRIIITGLNLEEKDGELMKLRSLTLKKSG